MDFCRRGRLATICLQTVEIMRTEFILPSLRRRLGNYTGTCRILITGPKELFRSFMWFRTVRSDGRRVAAYDSQGSQSLALGLALTADPQLVEL